MAVSKRSNDIAALLRANGAESAADNEDDDASDDVSIDALR